jgi:hypothetical protein
MPIKVTIQIEAEAETPSPEAEVADLQASTIKASIQALPHHSLVHSLKTSKTRDQKDLPAKSVGN